ncbi:CvpA family protein [Aquimarina hainanensis]|uniref:CvpA family protein n=1 Tax=Aquimarina hainanensis TaxID=1578017 RepID=A0ABW5N8B7_9FLAO|nr:CvpA family protein [Aquimarina sp. TRL1]QKX04786.1 CvpA family protein [Aquimarina sp. TRL1]
MNYIDIILGVLLLWGVIRGLNKGLFVSLASLVALIAGIYIAIHFSHHIGAYLKQYVDWQENILKLTAFAITFIAVVLLVSLAGKILTKIADFASLGILNKLLGGLFGLLKVAFIISVILMFLDAGNKVIPIVKQETLQSSILYTPVRKFAPSLLPDILKEVNPEEEKQA